MRPDTARAIRRAYLAGDTLAGIAKTAGVSLEEAEVYLRWWCSQGCPE